MYRFGDGTPFPIQDNFIDTLLAAVDACVGTFSAAAEIEERREKTRAARRDAEEELRRFGVLEKALESAVAPLKPSVDRLASPSAQGAARALAAARTAIGASRATVEQRLQQLSGEPRVQGAMERMETALAVFFDRHQLPDTQWRWTWGWNGARAVGDAIATSGRFHATFDLELEGPWRAVPRVGLLVPGLHAVVPKRGLLGKPKRTRVSLDKAGVIAVERTPEIDAITIREHAGKPSMGWRIVLRDPDRHAVVLVPVDLSGRACGNEVFLSDADAAPFETLWATVDDALLAMLADKRRLRDLHIGDASLDTITDPAAVGRAILGVLGPIVRQIRQRSRVPGELAIKRDIGDGRREELYVPREQIARRFETLPPTYRRPFEDIGLGRQATAEIASADEAVTMPEPPARGSKPKLDAAAPPPTPAAAAPAKKPDVLAKLPPVPPTRPPVPLRAKSDGDSGADLVTDAA